MTESTDRRTVLRGLTTALLLVLATACGSSDGGGDAPRVSLEKLAAEALGTMPGLASLDVEQAPVDGTNPTDRSDPDLWTLDITVHMSQDVTTDQVASAADMTRAFADAHVGSARWTAHLTVGTMHPVPEEDRSAPSPVQIDVYPTTRRSAADDARDALSAHDIPHVDSVAIAGGRPSVEVGSAADLRVVIGRLRQVPLWDEGGLLHTADGRVRLNDVPRRVTAAQISAIIDAGVAYPHADLALESSGDSPELYVNHLTVAQARALVSSFTAPGLAHEGTDGFVLEFDIRGSDAGQTVDTHGTFGQPEAGAP